MHPYATDSEERRLVPFFLAALSIGLAWVLYIGLQETDLAPLLWWLDIPSVMGFYGLLHMLIDRVLWRCPLFSWTRLVRVPDLRGEWNGYVTTSHEDHATQLPVQAIIRQTWTRLSVVLKTSTSVSQSETGMVFTQDGEQAISYEYFNEPKAHAVGTMNPHRGTARLEISRAGAKDILDGEYYSGRGRQNVGILHLERSRKR